MLDVQGYCSQHSDISEKVGGSKMRKVRNENKRMRADLGAQSKTIRTQLEELCCLYEKWEELVDEHVARLDEIKSKCKRISELQGTIDSLKRQNRELQANLVAKDGIIKKQTIMLEEANPKEAKYIKAGNQYFCSNCNADFQHYELYDKYCPECGAKFSNHRKD